MSDVDYQSALDYIYGFVDYSRVRLGRDALGKFDLGRMRALAAAMGNPHMCYPAIHVAGSKGKGSVVALCASVLQAAGLSTGMYISPHLVEFAERISIDGKQISPQALIALVKALKPYVEVIPGLTTFEIITAIAFWHFSRQKVDAAVFEVGLGGRLDATNIITPKVSVITSISYDHTAVLGDSLAEIAAEKAGIVKPGVPLVLAPQKEEVAQAIMQVAAEQQASLLRVGDDVVYEVGERSLDGQIIRVANKGRDWQEFFIKLLGHHQVENAATAFAALSVWREQGLPINDQAIRDGFASAYWPGRFELLQSVPPLLIDCAHNRDSAFHLMQTVNDYFADRPVVLIFGSSEDKDISGMFDELLPRTWHLILTRSLHPRAASPGRLAELARSYGVAMTVTNLVEDALSAAVQMAEEDMLILATGSLFVASAVSEVWKKIQG